MMHDSGKTDRGNLIADTQSLCFGLLHSILKAPENPGNSSRDHWCLHINPPHINLYREDMVSICQAYAEFDEC